MTTSIYLRTLCATWLLALLLIPCHRSGWGMACWLLLCCPYCMHLLACLIDLDHADTRMLPREPEHGEQP